MGIVKTEITLINKADLIYAKHRRMKQKEIRQMTVEATVDTGAWTLVINEETRAKLGLDDDGFGEADFADGYKGEYPMAGPLEIRWKNRRLTCSALVLPDAKGVLLGAIPLEGMDLTINPKRELVGVHGDRELHRI